MEACKGSWKQRWNPGASLIERYVTVSQISNHIYVFSLYQGLTFLCIFYLYRFYFWPFLTLYWNNSAWFTIDASKQLTVTLICHFQTLVFEIKNSNKASIFVSWGFCKIKRKLLVAWRCEISLLLFLFFSKWNFVSPLSHVISISSIW